MPALTDVLDAVDSAPELTSSVRCSATPSSTEEAGCVSSRSVPAVGSPVASAAGESIMPHTCRGAEGACSRANGKADASRLYRSAAADGTQAECAPHASASSSDVGVESWEGIGEEYGDVKGWGDDDDDDDGAEDDEDSLSDTVVFPKLTDADFASAFHKARASSWAVRKQLGLDGGVRARTCEGSEPVLMFAGLIDILQARRVAHSQNDSQNAPPPALQPFWNARARRFTCRGSIESFCVPGTHCVSVLVDLWCAQEARAPVQDDSIPLREGRHLCH